VRGEEVRGSLLGLAWLGAAPTKFGRGWWEVSRAEALLRGELTGADGRAVDGGGQGRYGRCRSPKTVRRPAPLDAPDIVGLLKANDTTISDSRTDQRLGT
jgi:hypothetical protein